MITSTTAGRLYEPSKMETQFPMPKLYRAVSNEWIMEFVTLENTFSLKSEAGVIEIPLTPKEMISAQRELFILDLHDSRLTLQRPIMVFLENDAYQLIAYAPDLDIYGYGDTEYEAIEDLRQSIVELYFDLKGEKLARSMEKIWNYLNSIVKESEGPRSKENI